MEERKAFEGFEVWFHERQMSLKMYLVLFLIFTSGWSVFFYVMYKVFADIRFQMNFIQYLKACFWSFFNPAEPVAVWIKGKGWRTYDAIVVCRALKPYIIQELRFLGLIYVTGVVVVNVIGLSRGKSFFSFLSEKIQRERTKRGSRIISAEELLRVLQGKYRELDLPLTREIRMPVELETRHVFIVGATGTGKTTILLNVLKRLRERGEKVVLFDIKGDYASIFYDPGSDIIMNPLDKRAAKWTVFNDLRSDKEVFDLAQGFIPPVVSGDGTEKYFRDAARDVFASVLNVLRAKGEESNRRIWELISGPVLTLVDFLKHPAGKIGFTHIEKWDSNQTAGIKSTMMQFCRIFYYMQDQDGDFSIRDFITEDGGGFLFITVPPHYRQILAPFVTAVLNLFITHCLSLPDDRSRRRFVIIDELGALYKISMLIDALTLGRSKGLSMWVGIQDFGRIDTLYGRPLRETLWNNSITKLILRVDAPDTAEYIANALGKAEVEETQKSYSMGPDDNRDGLSLLRRTNIKHVLLASEIQKIEDLTAIVKVANFDAAYPCCIVRPDLQPIHPGFIERSEPVVSESEEREEVKDGEKKEEAKDVLEGIQDQQEKEEISLF